MMEGLLTAAYVGGLIGLGLVVLKNGIAWVLEVLE